MLFKGPFQPKPFSDSLILWFYSDKDWKLMSSGKRRMFPAPPACLQLQNRFSALLSDEGLEILPKEWESSKPKPQSSTRRKWQVVVKGDMPLWGTETPICQSDLLRMLWRACWDFSSPWTITLCCFTLWVPTIVPGETWNLWSDNIILGLMVKDHQEPRWFSPRSCQEREYLEDEWTDPAGQQLVL